MSKINRTVLDSTVTTLYDIVETPVLRVPNDLVLFEGNQYRWIGSYPKEVVLTDSPSTDPNWECVSTGSVLSTEDGAGSVGFSHAAQYPVGSIGNSMSNEVWVTDAPYHAKMDGVTDDTSAFQAAIDSGKVVRIPKGTTVISKLKVYPNTCIIGSGKRHGIKVQSGTECLFKGVEGEDLFTFVDRTGQVGDGQGGLILKDIVFINASNYLELPDPSTEKYYLYRPNAEKVLSSNSRGLFAVGRSHSDWGNKDGWLAPKTGGTDCPFLIIDNVKFQNFTYPLDVSTWMSTISNFETYLCGITRITGTSTSISCAWPRNPLTVAWQLAVNYSEMRSSSLGENYYSGSTGGNGGLECYEGVVSLYDVGYEQVRGTVINAVRGTVNVYALSGVTGSTNKPSRLGMISGSRGFINWYSVPRMYNSEGVQVELAFGMFSATTEALLSHHCMRFSTGTAGSWITKPWLSKSISTGSDTIAPYVSQEDSGLVGTPYVVYPSVRSKYREVPCMQVGFKDRVLIRGTGKYHSFRVFGGFEDGVTSASSQNPRQKHGALELSFTRYSSPMSDGTSNATPTFTKEWAVCTFSKTLEGRVYDVVHSDGVSLSGTITPVFVRVTQQDDGGLLIEFGLNSTGSDSDMYKQVLVDVSYTGSYPSTNTDEPVKLNIVP